MIRFDGLWVCEEYRSICFSAVRDDLTEVGKDLPGAYGTGSDPEADGAYILMQFTGLYDKNSKEIYEGDIVQTPFGHSSVEFSHGVFGLNHDFLNPEKKTMLGTWGQEHNLRTLDDGYYKEIVVVGNIYENPELIP